MAAAGVELLPGDGAALVAPGAAALVGAGGTEAEGAPPAPDELELPQAALVSARAPTARVAPVRRADRVTILNVTSSKGDGLVSRGDSTEYGPPHGL